MAHGGAREGEGRKPKAGGCILKSWFAEKNFGGSTWGICCHY